MGLVGGGEGESLELLRPDPAPIHHAQGPDLARTVSALVSVQRNFEMTVGMVDFHKLPPHINGNSQLFVDFTTHRIAKRLPAFLFTAGKTPRARPGGL